MSIRGQEHQEVDPEKVWTSEDFEKYLLSAHGNPHQMLDYDARPQQIDVSPGWHAIFNSARDATKTDGLEHLVAFSITADGQTIIPSEQVEGSAKRVDTAQAYEGPPGSEVIGDIHSHKRILFLFNNTFSYPDLRNFSNLTRVGHLFMGLSTQQRNLLVLATRGTISKTFPGRFLSLKDIPQSVIAEFPNPAQNPYFKMRRLALYSGKPNAPLCKL